MKAIISKSFYLALCFILLCFSHIAYAQEADTLFRCELAEEMPLFPGGTATLLKYISTNLKYPEGYDSNRTYSRIFVGFVVNKSGKTAQVKIVRSSGDAAFDLRIIKLVENMPLWKPGKFKGEEVDCNYTLPISIHWAQ